jgi:hypothetical protein
MRHGEFEEAAGYASSRFESYKYYNLGLSMDWTSSEVVIISYKGSP